VVLSELTPHDLHLFRCYSTPWRLPQCNCWSWTCLHENQACLHKLGQQRTHTHTHTRTHIRTRTHARMMPLREVWKSGRNARLGQVIFRRCLNSRAFLALWNFSWALDWESARWIGHCLCWHLYVFSCSLLLASSVMAQAHSFGPKKNVKALTWWKFEGQLFG